MLLIFWGVVCATGGGQTISTCSPRFLVVTGKRLGEVPVRYKSAKKRVTYTINNQNNRLATMKSSDLLPYLTLALSTPIPKLMVATITSTFPCIHSFCTSVRSPAFKPATADVTLTQIILQFSNLTHAHRLLNDLTCVIWLGQEPKFGQLVSHNFTAFSCSTVHNPTALFTKTNKNCS